MLAHSAFIRVFQQPQSFLGYEAPPVRGGLGQGVRQFSHRLWPAPPAHLRPETADWWRTVLADYELEEHHVRLLHLACEAWDCGQQARERLDRDGLTIPTGDAGMKAHPAIAIERDARIGFARLVRELDLDAGAPAESRRPPALTSNRRL